jgi:hypothetical protein
MANVWGKGCGREKKKIREETCSGEGERKKKVNFF